MSWIHNKGLASLLQYARPQAPDNNSQQASPNNNQQPQVTSSHNQHVAPNNYQQPAPVSPQCGPNSHLTPAHGPYGQLSSPSQPTCGSEVFPGSHIPLDLSIPQPLSEPCAMDSPTCVGSTPSVNAPMLLDWCKLIPTINFGAEHEQDYPLSSLSLASRLDFAAPRDGCDISSYSHINDAFLDTGSDCGLSSTATDRMPCQKAALTTPISTESNPAKEKPRGKKRTAPSASKPRARKQPKIATPKLICHICYHVFTSQAQLQSHQAICSPASRIYTCELCAKSFNQKCTLRIHRRSHTGERPYTCRFCSKCFTDSSSRSKHELTHTNERMHACTLCPYRSNQKGNLKRHLTKVHQLL